MFEHYAVYAAMGIGLAFVGMLCGAVAVSFTLSLFYPHIMLDHDEVERQLSQQALEHELKWPEL